MRVDEILNHPRLTRNAKWLRKHQAVLRHGRKKGSSGKKPTNTSRGRSETYRGPPNGAKIKRNQAKTAGKMFGGSGRT